MTHLNIEQLELASVEFISVVNSITLNFIDMHRHMRSWKTYDVWVSKQFKKLFRSLEIEFGEWD